MILCDRPAQCRLASLDGTPWCYALPVLLRALPKHNLCSSPLDVCRPPPSIARPWRAVYRRERPPLPREPLETTIARCRASCERMRHRVVVYAPRPSDPADPLVASFRRAHRATLARTLAEPANVDMLLAEEEARLQRAEPWYERDDSRDPHEGS